MSKVDQPAQKKRRAWQRWSVMVVVLAAILIYEIIGLSRGNDFPGDLWAMLDDLLVILFGVGAFLAVDRMFVLMQDRSELQQRNQQLALELSEAKRRQQAILTISQQFIDTTDDAEVVDLMIRISLNAIGAQGASFVPLDEHSQPMAMQMQGEVPSSVSQAWMEYLASPAVRQECGVCQTTEEFKVECPLLKHTMWAELGIYCLPLRRAGQEFGILNLYFPQRTGLNPEQQLLLRTLLDGAVLALEGLRLRRQAMTTIQQLQMVRENTDMEGLLSGLIKNLHETLDAEIVMILVGESLSDKQNRELISGEIPDGTRHLVDGILQSVRSSGQPVMLENVGSSLASTVDLRALMAVPMIAQDQSVLGAILVANRRSRPFQPRQMAILQTIANQVALVVQNMYLMVQLEYKTMIAERTRLAREIHDGLAQTLGFLKLKMAQLISFLEQGRSELALDTAQTNYAVLAEAYEDTRQAIDGLRIASNKNGISGWLRQIAEEFEEFTGIQTVFYEPETISELSPEIHAQLIRIVQEALSNVRKHANASQVELLCREIEQELLLEIRDNGDGFSPVDVPGPSQHGLRGMRERSDLIGAEFQVISQPQRGTTISLRLPLNEKVQG